MSEKPFDPSLLRSPAPAQQTVKDAQKFLASIVEYSEDAIIGCTPEGIIVSWNRAAQKLFGFSAEEIVGENIVTLAIDEAKPAANAAIQRMQRGQTVFPFDSFCLTKDGCHIEISCSASPVKDTDGTLMGVAAIIGDEVFIISCRRATRSSSRARPRSARRSKRRAGAAGHGDNN